MGRARRRARVIARVVLVRRLVREVARRATDTIRRSLAQTPRLSARAIKAWVERVNPDLVVVSVEFSADGVVKVVTRPRHLPPFTFTVAIGGES